MADADASDMARPDRPSPLAPTPRPSVRSAPTPTPATARMAPPPRRRRIISVTPVGGDAGNGVRKSASCGTECATEYCMRGQRVSRLPHHSRQPQAAGAPPEAPATPAATGRQHDNTPIHLTDSASQSRMDVDCDDAPFELTELDHLALTSDYARAHALADAQAQTFNAYASDVTLATTRHSLGCK